MAAYSVSRKRHRTHYYLWIGLVGLLCLAFSWPVLAQDAIGRCGPSERMLDSMEQRYGEVPVGQGLTFRGYVFIVTANEETGEWSLLIRAPHDLTCLVNFGTGWEAAKPRPGL